MTNPSTPASPEAKANLRQVVAYIRTHETNPVILANVSKALAPLNAKVSRHEPITESNLAAAWVALRTASVRSRAFDQALASIGTPAAPQPPTLSPEPVGTPDEGSERKPTAPRPRFDNIAEGSYAYATDDGHVAFIEVLHKTYPSGTYAFANLLVGSPGDWSRQRLSRDATITVLTKVQDAGVEESARLFGQKTESCGHCGSPLSNLQSRVAGYGRDCASNHGYWYPSLKEAREISGETKDKAS